MQAVKVLENLGNTISQQLDLGNESSVTFQEVSEELGQYTEAVVTIFFHDGSIVISLIVSKHHVFFQFCACFFV